MTSSYCSENNFFQTFLYLLAYFVGILLFLHVISLCGPFDKLVQKLGVDTYQYWMVIYILFLSCLVKPFESYNSFCIPYLLTLCLQTYELNYRPNVPKAPRKFRCIKIKLTRLESKYVVKKLCTSMFICVVT
jgi:hypothetical protein